MAIDQNADVALLRTLVRGNVDEVRQALCAPTTDAARFLRFAFAHQLGAAVYRTLRDHDLSRTLSPPLLAAAKAAWLSERTRSERLVRQMHELGELFDAGGVRVLFLKGPLLAQRYYGSVDARGFADLDILVASPTDLDQIEALLLGVGFERESRVLLGRRLTRYFSHHFEYRHGDLPLDVHWVLQRHFTFAIDYSRLWHTTARVTLEDRIYETTSNEYELVLQLIGIATDLQVGKLVLRSLVDVVRILQTIEATMDWDDFFWWRERERILGVSLYGLTIALEVLDCHADFPNLAGALSPRRSLLPPTGLARDAVLESRPLALWQKLLALRLYDTSLAASLAWWAVSLPFRIAVYGIRHRP